MASIPQNKGTGVTAVHTVQDHHGQSPLANVESFRNIAHRLSKLRTKKPGKAFALVRPCHRLCYHDDAFWCLSYKHNVLDVYNMDGALLQTTRLEGVESPQTLHPWTPRHMLLAAESGLYLLNIKDLTIQTRILQSKLHDVHIHGNLISVLEQGGAPDDPSDYVRILEAEHLHKIQNHFPTRTRNTDSLLLHSDRVSVSHWGEPPGISEYTLAGKPLRHCGKGGVVGIRSQPRLCGYDNEGSLLVVDTNSDHTDSIHRVWVVNRDGGASAVRGLDVEKPLDVVIQREDMWVLHGEKCIQMYRLKK